MTSNASMTIEDVVALHEAGESPWPQASMEFDLAMIKGLETGTFEDPKNGKVVDMAEIRRAGIAASGVTLTPLTQLKDIQDRPLVLGKRYLFRVASSERDRMTDFEDNNFKKVVNNAKWHNGIWLKLSKKWPKDDCTCRIEYPGRGKWLVGTNYSSNDVKLTNDQSNSAWMFEFQGQDSHGYPSYAIYADQWGAIDYGGGFWMPDNSIARAGYDNDHEWRTYDRYQGADQGWFNIMFERVDYNE